MLLPYYFKKWGWCLLIPSAIAGIFITLAGYEASWLEATSFAVVSSDVFGPVKWLKITDVNLTATLVGSLFIIGALLVGFSKEKREDEFIARLRLSSLLWAVWVSYALLLLAFLFVFGTAFFTVMTYNLFTVLIFFIFRFNYLLYKASKTV